MKKIRFTDYYDVWGNSEEGYFVNNATEEIDTIKDLRKETILEYLKDKGFLKKSVTLDDLQFDDFGDGYEISEADTSYMLCCIEEI